MHCQAALQLPCICSSIRILKFFLSSFKNDNPYFLHEAFPDSPFCHLGGSLNMSFFEAWLLYTQCYYIPNKLFNLCLHVYHLYHSVSFWRVKAVHNDSTWKTAQFYIVGFQVSTEWMESHITRFYCVYRFKRAPA